jgi:hypothetical protein
LHAIADTPSGADDAEAVTRAVGTAGAPGSGPAATVIRCVGAASVATLISGCAGPTPGAAALEQAPRCEDKPNCKTLS